MNNTPNSNRKHISFFGKTNAGKSSLLNAITEQNIAIVSEVKGTTTDSVVKAMELIPFGPVLFIDTAGLDDSGLLGKLRVEKALKELRRTDFAILVLGADDLDFSFMRDQMGMFKKFNIPYIIVINKMELLTEKSREEIALSCPDAILVSAHNWSSILNLKEILIKKLESEEDEKPLIGDLLPYNSTVVLVVPIDSEAPKGRIILPQVQLIRDCLDHGIKSYVVRDTELEATLSEIKNPDLIITDSQAFKEVDQIVAGRAPLTGFSVLFARQKGELSAFVQGIHTLEKLEQGSKILIAETCTHNTSHEDIGRVKIPKLIKKVTGKDFQYTFHMGGGFPENLEIFDLIIHCGACMINRKNMISRIEESNLKNIPITNYGIAIAYLSGILDKSLEIFKKL